MIIRATLCAVVAACACAGAGQIEKRGTIACDLVEATPIVFGDTLYRFEYVRDRYAGNELRQAYFRFVDIESGETTPPFAAGHHLGSAFVDNGRMYVYGVPIWGANVIHVFWSDDLQVWHTQDALRIPGWTIYNNTVCKDDDGYTMAIEIGAPPEIVGRRFTIYFARSENLLNWTLMPLDHVYSKTKYTACPALRYYDGWYYMVYLERVLTERKFVPYIVRSRDLRTWEISTENPLMEPGPEDKAIANPALTDEERAHIEASDNVNNSDLDFCEHDGKTLIYYSWGNQRGTEFLAEAVYGGSERAFVESYFDE